MAGQMAHESLAVSRSSLWILFHRRGVCALRTGRSVGRKSSKGMARLATEAHEQSPHSLVNPERSAQDLERLSNQELRRKKAGGQQCEQNDMIGATALGRRERQEEDLRKDGVGKRSSVP